MNNLKQINNFLRYLTEKGVSKVSLKFYKSDIVNFLKWKKDKQVSNALVKQYLNEIRLITPNSTINRRLSTLRSYSQFINNNFMIGIENVGFNLQSDNKPEKLGFYTSIFNKLSSVVKKNQKIQNILYKIFFNRPNWYKKYHSYPLANYVHIAILILFSSLSGYSVYDQVFYSTDRSLAFPSALERPNRFLSFQGRLTDNLGNPETTATNMVFKLYDVASGGTALWDSGTCSITPDQDGIFSTLFGSSCGSEIASSVFSENAEVWLGVTVGGDAEATPRIQIATVAYSLNSETLQGFPAGTGASNIPYIDSTGKLAIAAASPTIESTSGTFAVKGQAMTISTADTTNGDITINPDGTGTLNLTFEGASPDGGANGFVNATNANITSGSLYSGTVASSATGYNFINFLSGVSPTSVFSVQNDGDIVTSGDLTLGGGNLNTGNIALTVGDATTDSITLQTDGTGNGEVVLPNDSVGPNELMSSGQTDEYCLTYETTGTTLEWQLCGAGGSSQWNDLTAPDGNLSLSHGTNTTTFNWDTGTGSNDLFTLNTDSSSDGTGTLLNIQTGASSTVNPFRVRSDTTESIFVNPTGNVGIGTITQDRKFEVFDSSNPQFRLTQSDNTNYADFQVDSNGDLLISTSGGDVVFANNNILNVGGSGTDTAFNAIADSVAGASANVNSDNDLYIEGNLEVDGTIYDSSGNTLTNYWTLSSGKIFPSTLTNLVGIGTNSPISRLSVINNPGAGNYTGKAAFLVDQYESQDILTASASGVTKLTLQNDGTLKLHNSSSTISNDTGDITLNAAGGDFDFSADNITNVATLNAVTGIFSGVIQAGNTTALSYSRLGTGTTAHAGNISASSDLLLQDLEVDGTLFLDGGSIANSAGTVALVLSSSPTDTSNTLSAGSWTVDNTTNVGKAALVINQTKSGDLLTASVSGTTKMSLNPNGDISLGYSGTSVPTTTTPLTVYNHGTTNVASIDISGNFNLSGTSITGTSLTNIDTSSSLLLGTTTLTLDSNSTINGGSAANDDLTLQGTSNATRTSSYVLLQPTDGNVGIGTTTPDNKLSIAGSNYLSLGEDQGDPVTGIKFIDNSTEHYRLWYDGSTGSGIANTFKLTYEPTSAVIWATQNGKFGINDLTPDAQLDVDSTSTSGGDFLVTNTGVGTSGSVASITANSYTTGDLMTISGTSLTSGSALVLNGPSGGTAGITDALLNITSDVGNVGASSDGLIKSTATFDGSSADGVNLFLYSTDAIASGNNDYGIYNYVSNTGAITTQTKNIYGSYTNASATGGTTTTPTTNVYGNYITTTATHATNVGTVNQYGMYIANGSSSTSGTSTKYGLYVEAPSGADANFAASLNGLTLSSTIASNSWITSGLSGINNVFGVSSSVGYIQAYNFSTASFVDLRLGNNALNIEAGGEVGIGTPTPGAQLHVAGSFSSATAAESYSQYISSVYSIADSGLKQGLRLNTYASHTTGTQSDLIGILSLISGSGNGGTTTQATPFWSRNDVGTGHTITSAYGMLINNGAGAGTITNQYGLYIGSLTKGSSENYSIYSGSAKSYFGGQIGINIASPSSDSALHVEAFGNRAARFNIPTLAAATSGVIISTDEAGTSGDYLLGMNSDMDGTPIVELTIASNGNTYLGGNLTLETFASSGTAALCWDNSGASLVNDCSGTPVADYAEIYPTEDDVNYGDIVHLSDNETLIQRVQTDKNGNMLDSQEQSISILSKTNNEYQSDIVGVVSENWSDFTSTGHNTVDEEENPKPIALSGRVKVNIDENSQEIKPGDYITTSNAPGKGMKATDEGRVIGMALEKWDSSKDEDTVLILVNNIWYDPNNNLTEAGDIQVDENENYLVEDQNGNIAKKVSSFAKIASAKIIAGIGNFKKLETNIISPIANSDLIIDLDPENSTESSKLAIRGINDEIVTEIDAEGKITTKEIETNEATVSGTLYANDIKSTQIEEIENLLKNVETNQNILAQSINWETNTATESASFNDLIAENVQINNIFVTGQAAFSSLFVQNGLTTSSLNSLNEVFKIQELAQAPLEIMAGKILIDTNGNTNFLGNVQIAGDLKVNGQTEIENAVINNFVIANNVETATNEAQVEGEISTNSIAGKATLAANTEKIRINNNKVSSSTLIYVTPITSTQNKVLFVKEKGEGYFEIGFNETLDSDVEFNWWIIELKQDEN